MYRYMGNRPAHIQKKKSGNIKIDLYTIKPYSTVTRIGNPKYKVTKGIR